MLSTLDLPVKARILSEEVSDDRRSAKRTYFVDFWGDRIVFANYILGKNGEDHPQIYSGDLPLYAAHVTITGGTPVFGTYTSAVVTVRYRVPSFLHQADGASDARDP